MFAVKEGSHQFWRSLPAPSGSERSWSTLLKPGLWRTSSNSSVYCNAVGKQKDFSFFGSKIVTPDGSITSEGKFDEEDFVVVLEYERWGAAPLEPLFRERNPSVYGLIAETDVPAATGVNGHGRDRSLRPRDLEGATLCRPLPPLQHRHRRHMPLTTTRITITSG